MKSVKKPENNKESKLSEKRMREILNSIGREAIQYVSGSDILQIFEDKKSWQACFDNNEKEDGMAGVFTKIIEYRGDSITQAEFEELVLPFIAERIARSLGAKRVIIEW